MSRGRLVFLTVAFAVAAIGPGSARAWGAPVASEAAAAPPQSRLIEIVIGGPDTSYEALAGALGPLLQSEEGVLLRRKTPSDGRGPSSDGPPQPRSGIWIEAGQKGGVRIVVVSSRGRAAERQIDGKDLTPVTAEIVAQIVHESTRALRAEDAGEAAPTAAGAAAPAAAPASKVRVADKPVAPASPDGSDAAVIRREDAPSARSPRDERFAYAVQAGYAMRLLFDPALVLNSQSTIGRTANGPVASVTVTRNGPLVNVFLSLIAEETWASTPALAGNLGFPALDLTTVSSRAVVGLTGRLSHFVEVSAGLGAGADYLRAQAGSTGSGSAWLIAGRAAVRLALLVPSTPLEVWTAITVDVRPRATFAESAPAGSAATDVTFFNTAPVQPGGMLGLGWRL